MLSTGTDEATQAAQSWHSANEPRNRRRQTVLRIIHARMLNQGKFEASDMIASTFGRRVPHVVDSNFEATIDSTNPASDSILDNGALSSCLLTSQDLSPAEMITSVRVYDCARETLIRTIPAQGFARAIAYRKKQGLVLVASSQSSSYFQCALQLYNFTAPHSNCARSIDIGSERHARVHAVTFTTDDAIAVATNSYTHVMTFRSEATRGTVTQTIVTGKRDAISLSSTPDGTQLVYITDDGHAYLRDIRAPRNDASWNASVCKPICDHTRVNLKVGASGRELYLAAEDGLSAWDFRMDRDGLPNRTFEQFEAPSSEWFYTSPLPCIFDLEEGASGGLLAATNDTGAVRLWDCYRGGNPLYTTYVPHPAQRVQFAAWTNESPCRPGLWVDTGRCVFMFRMHGSRLAS